MPTQTLTKSTLRVADLDPASIRAQWLEYTGTRPPRYVSRTLLIRMLADRIQSADHGGISRKTHHRLLKIATELARGGSTREITGPTLKAGTMLLRNWQGTRHQVLVLEEGFSHDGQTYRSLSEVARKITGTRWSGPAFFGLTRRRTGPDRKRGRP